MPESILTLQRGVPTVHPDIERRFKQVHENLGLKYIEFPIQDGANTNGHQVWAIIFSWEGDDPRREMVRRGDMPETAAFDILGWLPADCTPDQAFAYFERRARAIHDNSKAYTEKVLNRLHKYNEDVAAQAMAPVKEYAEELIEANVGTLFEKEGKAIPKIFTRPK